MTRPLNPLKLAVLSLLTLASSAQAQTKGTFLVQDGAFPWYDRVGTWALAGVPDTLKGNSPLPQQNCSERTLETEGDPASITLAVSEKDAEKFKAQFTSAKATGETLAVVNPGGTRLPYLAFTLPHPPARISGGYQAGFILLKSGAEAAAAPGATVAAAGATTGADANGTAAQNGAKATGADSAKTNPPNVGPGVVPPATVPPAAPAVPTAQVPLPAHDKLHIYLLMGQSNMVGRDTTTLADQVDDPHILALSDSGSWVVAREPMSARGSGMGPGTSFAREMLKASPGITIGLVPCAVGGTPLSRWVKGADLYENAVKRAKMTALSGEICGVLWHQGESDTTSKANAESCESRLTQMFKDLREDLNQPILPIAVGQLGELLERPKYPFLDNVTTALGNVVKSLPNVGLAESSGLGDKGDRLHFSAISQNEFGVRYARAMQKLEE